MNIRLLLVILSVIILQGCNAFDPPPPVVINPSTKEWADAVSKVDPEQQLRLSRKLHVKFKLGYGLDNNVYSWSYYDDGVLKSMPGGWTVNYSLIQYFNDHHSSIDAVEYTIIQTVNCVQDGCDVTDYSVVFMLRYALCSEAGENLAVVSYGGSIPFNIFKNSMREHSDESNNVAYANAFLKMALDLDQRARAGTPVKPLSE